MKYLKLFEDTFFGDPPVMKFTSRDVDYYELTECLFGLDISSVHLINMPLIKSGFSKKFFDMFILRKNYKKN